MAETKKVSVTWRKPVSWLDPLGLARTGVMAIEAALFGSYADRREVIAALSPHETSCDKPALSYATDANEKEFWFDYISDTGDGWNATYAIACLAGAETLHVLPPEQDSDEPPVDLPRGRFTILGGDEVYPTASLEDYKERLTDPFWCAHSAGDDKNAQIVYALPGNHDWYDGLTSFMRLFLQRGRSLGPWKTEQGRTYFAIQLPHRWWIWGVDVQLESDVDAPQTHYFQYYADKFLHEGDRVILCTPEPSWVEGGEDKYQDSDDNKSKTHDNLVHLEKMILEKKAKIPLRIAGDLHHYARYQGDDGESQLVTCGGGGAFLHSTHPLPETIVLTKSFHQIFALKHVFPTADWCKDKRKSVFNLIQKNSGFSLTAGLVYAFYAWILESASQTLAPSVALDHVGLLKYFQDKPDCPLWAWLRVLEYSPASALLTLALLTGTTVYGVKMKRLGNGWLAPAVGGFVHGIAHLSLAIFLMWLSARIWLFVPHLPTLLVVIAVVLNILSIVAAGGILGGLLMALYLYLANVFYAAHDEEVFSCQAIEDYKGFARFRVTKDGVTLYPIGLKTVPKGWAPAPGIHPVTKTGGCEPNYAFDEPAQLDRLFEPVPPYTLEPHLIEKPITFGPADRPHASAAASWP